MATAALRRIGFLVLAIPTLAGCFSSKYDPAYRHQKLLELYPLGTTTRADVAAKWGKKKPDFSIERPAAGWLSLAPFSVDGRQANIVFFVERALNVEKRVGVSVYRMERFWGTDGLSSLCYCWFYYGQDDKLIDVEWQYKSD